MYCNQLISAHLPCRDRRCGTPRMEGHLSPPPANEERPTVFRTLLQYVQATILYLTKPSMNTTRTSANQIHKEVSDTPFLCFGATRIRGERRPS